MPGLDAAAAAPSAAGQWRVLVASRLNDSQAQNFARTLRADGFDPVAVEDRSGAKAVLVGAMPNEAAARALMQTLVRDMSYSVEGVEGPGAAPGTRTAPTAQPATAQVWRVVVDEFSGRGRATDEQAAGKLRETLLQDDYLNVEVDEAGPDIFRVTMGSFPTEADAAKLADLLKSEGYARAAAKTLTPAAPLVGTPGDVAAPTLLPIPQLTTEQLAGLTQEQQRELYDLLRELRAAQDGKPLSFEETQRLTARVRSAEGRFGEVLATAREAQRIRADLDRRIFSIYRDFNRALLEQQYDEAQAKLDEIRSLDPNEENLQARQDRLGRQRGGGGAPGGDDTEQLRRVADEAFAKGDLPAALKSYQTLLARNPSNSELAVRIGEINSRMAGDKPAEGGRAASSGQGMPSWVLYGGIALLVVILLLAGMQFANMRRERQLLQEVKELASNSGRMKAVSDPAAGKPSSRKAAPAKPTARPATGKGALAGGSALAGMDAYAPMPDPVIAAEQQDESDEVPAEEMETVAGTTAPIIENRPHGEPDVLVLHDVSPPPPPAAPRPAAPAVAESIDLSGLDFSTPMPSVPTAPAEADSPFGSGGLKLDDLPPLGDLPGGIPGPVESTPATPQTPILDIPAPMASVSLPEDLVPFGTQEATPLPPPPPAEAFAETARIDIPPPPPLEAAVPEPTPIPAPPEPPTPAPAAAANAGDVFFAQDFSSFAVGEKPSGWQGEYDYATLTVADNDPPEGTDKFLKFEKRSGAGSANYACKFPNASGRVKVDFDLRCDDKNKYLLGFYIEKDEDFKQSVHTIVHRTDSRTQPTLRIHGEPIPYDLGTWRHICYQIDLLSGLVSASVNGEEVVRNAKLPSNPAFVNTLSIRDNLATTGVLCIANLRISKG